MHAIDITEVTEQKQHPRPWPANTGIQPNSQPATKGLNGIKRRRDKLSYFFFVLFLLTFISKEKDLSPGHVAQLVGDLSRYAKVVGSVSGQGAYRNQPMNT